MKRERADIEVEPERSDQSLELLMSYPLCELARMSLDATKKAAFEKARALAAETKLMEVERKLSNYLRHAPTLAMLEYPDQPLKALWTVLKDATLVGPASSMSIINDPRCGAQRKVVVDKNDPFWSNVKYFRWIDQTATTILCLVIADRLDVYHALMGQYGVPKQRQLLKEENTKMLEAAALHGRVEFLKIFIAKGLDVNATDSGAKPLHLAVEGGHIDCVKMLVEAKAVVNALDNSEKYPLHLAAEEGFCEIVKFLVSHGADVKAFCANGYGPLFYARGGGDATTISFLESCGASIRQ